MSSTDRAKGFQSCCFGGSQSSSFCDIHAFVGARGVPGLEALSGRHVPLTDRFIQAAAE